MQDANLSNGHAVRHTLDGSQNGLTSEALTARFHSKNYPIVVHSHLRWDWVWQRPQQFLSRFAKTHHVLFVEGPHVVEENIEPRAVWRRVEGHPHIVVMHTEFPASRWGAEYSATVDVERYRLLRQVLDGPLKGEFDRPVQWFYDPMAAPCFAGRLGERAIVYDCMDELSQFKGAPPALVERERFLLDHADVVFAGGRKMWQSKSRFNSNCHFYGCGVDVSHFSTALHKGTRLPGDVADMAHPILGYFGVVDERLDYELIVNLADANPDWSIVMVGPVCKIDENELPRRANLHWLGGREYSSLPAYAKAFDVCLMPFAMNEATEYINPTKALEYMATGTPIVSSPVPDVVSNFSSVVKIGQSQDEFIALCRNALAAPDRAAIERGFKMANENTWEAIVAKMENHIAGALQRRSLPQIVEVPGTPTTRTRVLLPSASVGATA
jgi:glycosyltransferase involved in cell wall biosynthesis